MRILFSLACLVLLFNTAFAQQVSLKVSKDTVRIENAELIIENSSKQNGGFLFNQNSGRTAFRKLGKAFQFKPGAPNFPAVGASTYKDSAFIKKHVKVWRNGLFQYRNYAKGITFDNAIGEITFYPALADTDNIYIEASEGFDTDDPQAPTGTASNLKELNAGVFDNGDNTFVLRWTTNHTSLYHKPKVVGIGSSTLEGVGTSYPDRLTDRISAWLTANTISPTWVNIAVGGYTTKNVMPVDMGGTKGHNIETALSLNPDFIYCVLTSNDASNNIDVGVSMANMHYLDNLARSKGVPIIFHTTQPRAGMNAYQYNLLWGLGDSIRNAWPNRVVDVYNLIADPSNVQNPLPLYDSGDGLHLNAAGTQVLARAFFKVIENYFQPLNGVNRYVIDTSYDGTNWARFDSISSGNIVKKTYTKPRTGLIYFRVKGELASSATITSNITSLVPPDAIGNNFDHRVLIDLGGDNQYTINPANNQVTGWPTPSPDKFGKYWNNWYGSGGALGFRDGALISDLATTANITTPLSVQLIGTPTYDGSVTTQAMNFGGLEGDVGDYPKEAVRDNMYLSEYTVEGIVLRIRGLNPANQYRIKLWGARLYDGTGTRLMESKLSNQTWD